MGSYWGGGLFGGRDNRLCCLWYSFGLGCGVIGLECLRCSGFFSGLLFSVVVFWPQISIVCVCCVCVCVCVCTCGFCNLWLCVCM